MKHRVHFAAVIVLGSLGFVAGLAQANSQPASSTVPGSTAAPTATEDHAGETGAAIPDGAPLYKEQCSGCHAPDLGGFHGPALKGAAFQRQWEGKTARKLYSLIRMTMPIDNPGTLTESQAVALTEEILKASKVPMPTPAPRTAAELDAVPLKFQPSASM